MAGYRKDAIFVQLLLFHIAVYPIMLIYFNPGISLIFIGILEFIFIFQASYFFEHLLSFSGYFPIQEQSFSGTISFALGAMAKKEAGVQQRLAAKVWLRVTL